MKNLKNIMTCMAVFLCLILLVTPKANAATEDIFTYEVVNGTAKITGCSAPTGAVTIPDTLGGCPVTSIGSSVFSSCTELTAVTIPDSVTTIESHAFYNCSGLTDFVLGKGVTQIGWRAFMGSSIENLYITDLSAWYKISFSDYANPLSYAQCGHILDENGNEMTEITVDSSLQSIPQYAFYNCKNLTSVTIPDSVTAIGDDGFYGCSSLASVEIPDTVASIGNFAFCGCSSLTAVEIPAAMTEIGESVFKDCIGLRAIEIPHTVTTIGISAFYRCTGLTSLVIPDSVTEIGSFAFCYCSGITEITMGKGLKKAGVNAFINCSSLKDVYVTNLDAWCNAEFEGSVASPLEAAECGHILDAEGNELTELVLDPDLQTVPRGAFSNCKNITSITIPNSVTAIGETAFMGCTGLTTLTIPDSVTVIGDSAFRDSIGLTTVTLPDGLTALGEYAFYDCTGLTAITIPNNLTKISKRAFLGCSGLTEVVIPGSVTVIENYAFSECTGLERVSMLEGVTTISEDAFMFCTKLKTLDLPQSLNAIAGYAFYYMPDVKTIYYAGSAEQWKAISINTHNNLFGATKYYNHTHDYTVVTQTATCTEIGFVRYTCVHGEVIEKNVVPALGHDYSGEESVIEPTCTQEGCRGVGCTRCDSVLGDEAIPALGHLKVEIGLREPTCSEKGVSREGSQCGRCGAYIKRPVWIPMVDHSWDTGVSCPPTDEVDGYLLYTCTVCGVAKTENEVTAQPEAQATESGNTVQFSVKVRGDVQSYRWQYRRIYKWFDTTMPGYDTNTLTVSATGARSGYDYRCEITFKDGTVLYSDPAELTVTTCISEVQSPNDQIVALGAKGQFTAAAQGEGIKYQWQYQRPNGETWINTAMEGATKPTVMIQATAARDGYKYRCKISDVTGNVAYTEVATLRVLSFTSHPEEIFTTTGTTVTFRVTANQDSGFTYQWQYSEYGNRWTNLTLPGADTDTLTIEATEDLNEYYYRCVLTGAKNSQVVSKAAMLHAGEPLLVFEYPADVTCKAGETATFYVGAGFVYSFRWQYQRPGGTNWYDTTAEGCQSEELYVTAKAGNNGYCYRCIVIGRDGTIYISPAATLTVE